MALILIWNFQEENKTNKTYINVIQLKIILQCEKTKTKLQYIHL